MASGIDDILNPAGEGRRDFLRKLIAGVAFAPPLLASFSLDGLSMTAANAGIPSNQCENFNGEVFFDFSGTQYQENFIDIFRPNDINPGDDLGETGHAALNFTGGAGAGGGTWGTILACKPGGCVPLIHNEGRILLEADILIHPFNNSKGVGLLAMAFDLVKGAPPGVAAVGDKGVALLVSNAGNTDKLQLVTVDTAGQVAPLKVVSLGAGIKQDVWYRLTMDIEPTMDDGITVRGAVYNHELPSDPDSSVLKEPVGTLTYEFGEDLQLTDTFGEVGIVARAVSAIVDSSVTNFYARWISRPV